MHKILSGFVGSLLIITSITRFYQILFDPIIYQGLSTIFEDFSGNNIFSLLGAVIITYGFYFVLGVILGYIYSLIYLVAGLSVLILRNDRKNIKSIALLTIVSGTLEFLALSILPLNSSTFNLIIFHLVIDILILFGSISIYIELKGRKHIFEKGSNEITKEFSIPIQEITARECLNTITLDCLDLDKNILH